MCSGFPTEKVEQMIVMSFYDVTMISHAIGGENYIREVSMSLGAGNWVFRTEQLSQILRKSLTLYCSYIGASCGEAV